MRIAVVTDGGAQMGMGHVQQSLTLARELRKHAQVRYFTSSDEVVEDTIRHAGFDVSRAADDAAILAGLRAADPDLVVFDKVDVPVLVAEDIRKHLRSRLAIFTNLTAANNHAHVVVLPRAAELGVDPARRFQNEAYVEPRSGTAFFYGPEYWMLRPEFHEFHRLGKEAPPQIRRVLLAFGGSDPTNLTALALGELLAAEETYTFDVIAGGHYTALESLHALLRACPERAATVTLHRNASNVGQLMYQADVAVTAAGMSMFEALCVGTPVIVIPQDQLQRDTYNGVLSLLEAADIHELPQRIARREFTDPRQPQISEMRIGQGFDALVECLLRQARIASQGSLATGASS